MTRTRPVRRLLPLVVAVGVIASTVGCSADDGGSSASSSTAGRTKVDDSAALAGVVDDVVVPNYRTLEGSLTEHWRFELRVYAASVQACLFHFDYWRFDGSDPTSRAGFWLPDSISVPAGYAFKACNPLGDYRIDVRDAQASPSGSPLVVLTWPFEVVVQRVTFA